MPLSRCVHLVVHESPLRTSLAKALEALGCQVQVYVSGRAFVEDLAGRVPGCVILNIHMPEIDGLEVQRRMNAAGLTMPVIVLDGHDIRGAVEAMKLGAMECLERPYPPQVLHAAVEEGFHRLANGRAVEAVVDAARETIARLTPREREVLLGLMAGYANKQIARDLAVSPRTVELHRANMMEKVGARGLPGVIRIAVVAGLDPADWLGSPAPAGARLAP